MALKIWDGFDHYNATNDFLARQSNFLQWQLPGAAQPTISFVTGRNGVGKAVKASVGGLTPQVVMRAVWADRNAEAYVGHSILIPSGTLGSAASFLIALVDTVAAAPQVSIFFNGNNYSIQIFRGSTSGTSLYLSPNNVWAGDVWNFIEYGVVIANSGGSVEVRVNGDTVASITGVDTQATANTWFDASDYSPMYINTSTTVFFEMDDIRYNDNATDVGSTANNSFMGDLGVLSFFPTGDGATKQWTPNSGTAHFSRVNEVAMDGDGSYNASTTPGQEDQLTFGTITNVLVIIYGVEITIGARKDDVGPRVVKSLMKSGGTSDYGANHSLPDTFAYFTDAWIIDPDTSASWTRTGFNAILAGYNLVS